MALHVEKSVEPLSEAARTGGSMILVESGATERLALELQRYRVGEIRGRSFLIAGHRGAGKTTLVKHAIQRVLNEEGSGRRPLFVPLHGPNFLALADVDPLDRRGPTETKQAEGGDGPAAAGRGGDSSPNAREQRKRKSDKVVNALEQLVLASYQALVREFIRCYRARLEERRRDGAVGQELFERAAQLEIELDRFPLPERLREHWEAGGFLRDGVLFEHKVRHAHADQGFRELVLLHTASTMYQKFSGEFKQVSLKVEERSGIREAEQGKGAAPTAGAEGQPPEAPAAPAPPPPNRDLASVVSVLAGVLGGGGVGALEGWWKGILSGFLVAIGSTLLFRHSWVRSQGRTRTTSFEFEEDLGRDVLDRMVPRLIDRIERAGLVPIFVVDELDKVKDLSSEIQEIVRYLKKLVAESGFFCFLTDRTFFERIELKTLEDPYPMVYTYFSDRLFVSFGPREYHDFLDQLISTNGPKPAEGVEGDTDRAIRRAEERDSVVLPYLLLRRSEMHAIDLRREIRKLLKEDWTLDLRPGELRSLPVHSYDLLYQLAVEIVLNEDPLRPRIQRSPSFIRLAYDALYFPIRERELGIRAFDFSETGETAFRWYLTKRMTPDFREDAGLDRGKGVGTGTGQLSRKHSGVEPTSVGADGPAEDRRADLRAGERLSSQDVRLLLGAVQRLTELLSSPFEFLSALDRWEDQRELESRRRGAARLPAFVLHALPFDKAHGFPMEDLWLVNDTEDRSARWTVSLTGTPFVSDSRNPDSLRVDLIYQLAVRLVMESSPFLQSVVGEARRAVLRGLWYPFRRWRRGPVFPSRSKLEDEAERVARRLSPRDSAGAELWTREIFEALWGLRGYLLDVGRLVREAEAAGISRHLDDVRSAFEGVTAPLDVRGGTTQWLYSFHGIARQEKEDVVGLERDLMITERVSQTLDELWEGVFSLSSLQGDLGLLKSSPDWTAVQRTIQDLRQGSLSKARSKEARTMIETFTHLLTGPEGEAVSLAVFCGMAVGRACGGDFEESVGNVAPLLGRARHASGRAPRAWLKSIEGEIRSRWPDLARIGSPPRISSRSLDAWSDWIESVRQQALTKEARVPEILAGAREQAWKDWLERVEGGSAGDEPREADLDTVLMATSASGSIDLLSLDPDALTWSRILEVATEDLQPEDESYVPREAADVAKRMLNLAPGNLAETRVLVLSSDSPQSVPPIQPGIGVFFAPLSDAEVLHGVLKRIKVAFTELVVVGMPGEEIGPGVAEAIRRTQPADLVVPRIGRRSRPATDAAALQRLATLPALERDRLLEADLGTYRGSVTLRQPVGGLISVLWGFFARLSRLRWSMGVAEGRDGASLQVRIERHSDGSWRLTLFGAGRRLLKARLSRDDRGVELRIGWIRYRIGLRSDGRVLEVRGGGGLTYVTGWIERTSPGMIEGYVAIGGGVGREYFVIEGSLQRSPDVVSEELEEEKVGVPE